MLLNLLGKGNNLIIISHSIKDILEAVGEHGGVKLVPLEGVHRNLDHLVIFDISGDDLGLGFPFSIFGDDIECVNGGQSSWHIDNICGGLLRDCSGSRVYLSNGLDVNGS